MGIVNYTYNRSTSGGEIITHLINATDGEGLHFDGAANTYVDCGDTTILDGATRMSMEVIVATSSIADGVLLAKTSASYCFYLRFDADGKLRARISNDASVSNTISAGTYNDGNPKHIVVTWDNATVSIYVNGNLDGTEALAGGSIPNTTDKLALGAFLSAADANSDNLDGILYRARLFNYVIDPTRFYENATVPFADQYGSQTVLIGVATGLDGWDALNTWNSQTTGGSNMILSANASGQYCRTNTALEVGKKYRLIYTAASVTGNSYFGGNWAGGFTNIHQIVAGTNTVDFTFEFASGFVNDYFYCHSGGIATVTLSNLSLVEIGCAVDLDLAFANPTQSLMVQDRAGNADGTSSATGVVQVTPIEQLNAKAARIGTSAATPADGELLVSGAVGVGTVPDANRMLHVKTTGTVPVQLESTTTYCQIGYKNSVASNCYLLFENTDFKIENGGATRLTIDSAGNAGIGVTPVATTHPSLQIGVDCTTNDSPNIIINDHANYRGEIGYSEGGNTELYLANIYSGSLDARIDLRVGGRSSTFDVLSLTGDGLTTVKAIVETNGVLKSNLLSNSGFDVWSNSTLENVATIEEDDCASDDTGDWTQTRTALAFVAGSPGHYTYTPSGGSNEAYIANSALTAGKLYKISVDVKNGVGSTSTLQLKLYDGSSAMISPVIATTGSFVTHTFVAECTATTANGAAVILDATHFSSDIQFKNFIVTEVTPGCVAADNLAFDGWYKDTALDLYREHNDGGTNTKDGSFYSLKTVVGTSGHDLHAFGGISSDAYHYQRFAGRTVTFGAWAKTSTASLVKLRLDDGSTADSAYHTGGDAWEWLEVTKTISATPTRFKPVIPSGTTGTYYISQPMLVFGSAIGSGNYSRPMGEIVWFEKKLVSNGLNGATISSTTNYTPTADSNGAIPKGAKQLYCQLEGASVTANSVLYSASEPSQQLEVRSQVSNVWNNSNGFLPVEAAGTFSLGREATFTAYLYYTGVQLR